MTRRTETSVLTALNELRAMEDERLLSEAQRAKEVELAKQRKLELERETARENEARRLADEKRMQIEAEARLRVEADRSHEQKLNAMRDELRRVEEDRLRARVELEARTHLAPASEPRGWAVAFGFSSLIAAALAVVLVMNERSDRLTPASLPAPVAPVSAALEIADEPETVVHEPAVVEESAPIVAEAPTRPRPRPIREREPVPAHDDDLGLEGLDEGDGMLPTERHRH